MTVRSLLAATVRPLGWSVLTGVLLLVGTGCASGGGGSSADSMAADDCVTGVAGSTGMQFSPARVQPNDGEATEISGAIAPNVMLLTGATVTVCGAGRSDRGALEAVTVDILEVDGMPALLGTLAGEAGAWRLVREGHGETLLDFVPDQLAAASGGVVWVAGAYDGLRFQVRSFGVMEGWR